MEAMNAFNNAQIFGLLSICLTEDGKSGQKACNGSYAMFLKRLSFIDD